MATPEGKIKTLFNRLALEAGIHPANALFKVRVTDSGVCGFSFSLVFPNLRGIPDKMILLKGGQIFFIEFKRPKGGRFSEAQKRMSNIFSCLGFPIFNILNGEDIRWALNAMAEKTMK